MQTFTKALLSASSNGQPILVAATADPGTLIHTATASTTAFDEIWLWLFNNDTVSHLVTIEKGGNATKNLLPVTVTGQTGLWIAIPGFPLNNGLTVKVYADAPNKIVVDGFVNQIV